MTGFDATQDSRKEQHKYAGYVGKWVIVCLSGVSSCGRVKSTSIDDVVLSPFLTNEHVLKWDLDKGETKSIDHYRIVPEEEGPMMISIKAIQSIKPTTESWAKSYVEATKDAPKL